MLKRILVILSPVCLATSVALAPDNPFIGKWTLVPSKSRMPDEMKVQSKGSNEYAFDFGGGVQFVFEYPDGPFHNTFTFDSVEGSWTSLMRTKGARGEWVTSLMTGS